MRSGEACSDLVCEVWAAGSGKREGRQCAEDSDPLQCIILQPELTLLRDHLVRFTIYRQPLSLCHAISLSLSLSLSLSCSPSASYSLSLSCARSLASSSLSPSLSLYFSLSIRLPISLSLSFSISIALSHSLSL